MDCISTVKRISHLLSHSSSSAREANAMSISLSIFSLTDVPLSAGCSRSVISSSANLSRTLTTRSETEAQERYMLYHWPWYVRYLCVCSACSCLILEASFKLHVCGITTSLNLLYMSQNVESALRRRPNFFASANGSH